MKLTNKIKLLVGAISITPLAIGLALGVATPAVAPTKADAALAKQQQKMALLKTFEQKTQLSDYELAELLKLVGFQGEALKTAWAVSKKESNGRPKAHNTNAKTGDNSYGIFQINMYKELEASRKAKFNLEDNTDLFNPVKNAQIAYFMSKGGKDWSSWNGITEKTKQLKSQYPGKPNYMKMTKKDLRHLNYKQCINRTKEAKKPRG